MGNMAPTKGNLMAAKRSKELARRGFDLMDKKRNILIRELMKQIESARVLQARVDVEFLEAYDALIEANIAQGGCSEIAEAIAMDDSLSLRYRSVMGVEIPTVLTSMEDGHKMPYGMLGTSSALDEAYIKFRRAKELIRELAEMENTIYRLAYTIKKTQKRANALKNVVIPGLEADIVRISDSLEEKDREEFVRLKVIKQRKKLENA